jgi:hypothetical protein
LGSSFGISLHLTHDKNEKQRSESQNWTYQFQNSLVCPTLQPFSVAFLASLTFGDALSQSLTLFINDRGHQKNHLRLISGDSGGFEARFPLKL